jgi:hypothetical protein
VPRVDRCEGLPRYITFFTLLLDPLTSVGSCLRQSAWGWSLSQGRLEFSGGSGFKRLVSGGPRCVVRKASLLDESGDLAQIGRVNETAAMRPCEESFEYLLMELPTTFR